MSVLNPHATVGQLVTERPNRSRVFEQWGLDYCCGGKKPLDRVCEERGLDLQVILRDLQASDAAHTMEAQTDWSEATLTELADHIEETHHAYLRQALPRLSGLIRKVVQAHGEQHPELREVERVFLRLRDELELHTRKEEGVLFPLCRQFDAADAPPRFHCGSIRNPVLVMEREHDSAGQALERLRALTHDFAPPAGACNTYRAMLDGLAELTTDLHLHIHKENNILFPRAIERETALQSAV